MKCSHKCGERSHSPLPHLGAGYQQHAHDRHTHVSGGVAGLPSAPQLECGEEAALRGVETKQYTSVKPMAQAGGVNMKAVRKCELSPAIPQGTQIPVFDWGGSETKHHPLPCFCSHPPVSPPLVPERSTLRWPCACPLH